MIGRDEMLLAWPRPFVVASIRVIRSRHDTCRVVTVGDTLRYLSSFSARCQTKQSGGVHSVGAVASISWTLLDCWHECGCQGPICLSRRGAQERGRQGPACWNNSGASLYRRRLPTITIIHAWMPPACFEQRALEDDESHDALLETVVREGFGRDGIVLMMPLWRGYVNFSSLQIERPPSPPVTSPMVDR